MRTSLLLAAAAALLLVPSLALAQPALTPAAAPLPDAPAPARPTERSPAMALGLSLGVTAAGYASMAVALETDNVTLVVGGLGLAAIGPSTGQWYAGRALSGGLVLRAAGAAAVTYGISQMEFLCERDCEGDDGAELITLLGLTAWTAGTVHDIVTAPIEAKRRNNRIHNLTLAPRITDKETSVVVAGRF